MEKERIRATRSKDKDEYWGYWLICDCGYEYNTEEATFCGGCGKEIIESREVKRRGYRKQSGWISVDDRFPDEMGEYLVSVQVCGKTHVTTAHFTPYSSRISWIECGVTHWMPLPELPCMESEEQT